MGGNAKEKGKIYFLPVNIVNGTQMCHMPVQKIIWEEKSDA